MFDNRVRIRDIELVTGLEFLTANRTLESVRTRTAAYPKQLDSNVLMTWGDTNKVLIA